MSVHDDWDMLSSAIINIGDFYEAQVLDCLGRYDLRYVVDVGANIGNHAVYFASICGATVYAFEPSKRNNAVLMRNAAKRKICIWQCALSDHEGDVAMSYELADNSGTYRVTDSGDVVPCYPLDDWLMSGINLLKIDVEGHERQVLEGARETIARCKPLILIEDKRSEVAALLPGYERVESWEPYDAHLYEWRGGRV